MTSQPKTLGELRQQPMVRGAPRESNVRQELRENLLCKMEKGEPLFPGVHGYDDTVIPQIVNAILSRHHFILLGLRGQAKSRILRGLMGFMDARVPVVEGCEIQRQSVPSDLPGLPRADRSGRRCHADRLAFARSALRGEAGHAGRDHRGHDWRRGSRSRRRAADEISPTS